MGLRAPMRRTVRRFERVLLGAAMSVAAFVIERRLLKAIREGGQQKPEPAPAAGRVTVAGAPAPDDGS
jgi:hypothetical protein